MPRRVPTALTGPRVRARAHRAPPQALHLALTQPRAYLRQLPEGEGLSADVDDAVLAYSLLDQVRVVGVWGGGGVCRGEGKG